MTGLRLPIPFGRPRLDRAPQLAVMQGYGRENGLQRNRKKLAALLFFLMLIYVLAYELFGRFMMVQFLIPLYIMGLLVVWALPETGRAPLRWVSFFFYCFLGSLLLWPDYLAVDLPGLPWITAARLFGMPMLLLMLASLSVSKAFRDQMKDIIGTIAPIWKLLAVFTVMAFLSIGYSDSMAFSMNRFTVALINWTGLFFVACFVFSRPGHAKGFAVAIWLTMLFWYPMTVWEWSNARVPWADHIPSFLAVEDESVQRVLSGSARAATGMYRTQAKFTTSLSYAELIAIAVPFVLHWMMTARFMIIRVAAAATLPAMVWMVIRTDSRLGMGGFLLAIMLYVLFWAIRRWRSDRESVFGPAITIAYPVLFSLFLLATFFIGRLRVMVWGGGQHQASNVGRQEQYSAAMPYLLERPWGYGIGRAAETLGFTNGIGVVSIDSYYLSIALDVGIVGFVVYYAMFVIAILRGGREAFRVPEDETLWLGPAVIALVNYVVIKSVLSQQENHPLVFIMLGMVVALMWRAKRTESQHERAVAIAPASAGELIPAEAGSFR